MRIAWIGCAAWVAAWRDDWEHRASRTPRVRVEMRQLKQWYRTLDQLLARKSDLEQALYLTLRDLFSLQCRFRPIADSHSDASRTAFR
jgi:hypothetical protein